MLHAVQFRSFQNIEQFTFIWTELLSFQVLGSRLKFILLLFERFNFSFMFNFMKDDSFFVSAEFAVKKLYENYILNFIDWIIL